MKSKTYILILIFCLAVLKGWSGGPAKWSLIDKKTMAAEMMRITKRFQHMKVYQVKVTHTSYADYSTGVAYQTSTGYFKRENKNFHNFLLGVHSIQANGCRLVIDSARKMMAVADPTEATDSIMPVSDYSQLYGLCTAIMRSTTGRTTVYHLEFDKKYSMSVIDFTVQDSLPSKVVAYYNREVKKGNMSTKPRLEIDFDDWKTTISEHSTAFDITDYVEKDGNKYSIKAPYRSKYKLLDERVFTRNDKK